MSRQQFVLRSGTEHVPGPLAITEYQIAAWRNVILYPPSWLG